MSDHERVIDGLLDTFPAARSASKDRFHFVLTPPRLFPIFLLCFS